MRSPTQRGAWTAVAVALLLAAAGVSATRASLVTPVLLPDNPNCTGLGYANGFKIEPVESGTFPFPDGTHSVQIVSNGTYFDWTATLGIDAVLVKGGPDANGYLYEAVLGYEPTADTGLHAPDHLGAVRCPALSHVEFCYDLDAYRLTVSKTAATSYDRTWNWTIDKSVAPAAWAIRALSIACCMSWTAQGPAMKVKVPGPTGTRAVPTYTVERTWWCWRLTSL